MKSSNNAPHLALDALATVHQAALDGWTAHIGCIRGLFTVAFTHHTHPDAPFGIGSSIPQAIRDAPNISLPDHFTN